MDATTRQVTGLAALMADEAVATYRDHLGPHIAALQVEHGDDGAAYFLCALLTQLACAIQAREGTLFAQQVLHAARRSIDERFGAFLADAGDRMPH